jgi:hypothetical protein
MAARPKRAQLHEGPNAARRFQGTMDRLLRVSKEELARREAAYQEESRAKTRRGPKLTEK